MDLRLAILISFLLASQPGMAGAETLPDLSHDPFAAIEQAAAAPIEASLPSDQEDAIELISCHDCGQPATACACSVPAELATSETLAATPMMIDTVAASLSANCQFTNLFWCNPYGEVYLDPCERRTCLDCNQADPPVWYASADLVPLARDQTDDLGFQRLGQAGELVLETGDFETELDAGARLTGGVVLTDLFRLDVTYLGAYEWIDRAAVRNQDPNAAGGNGDLFGPFSNFGTPVPQPGTDFNNFASINMESQFSSIELNLRRRLIVPVDLQRVGRLCVANSMLIGVRHLKLDEVFGYRTSSTAPAGGTVNRADIATENSLTGLQIGLMSQFLVRHGQGWVDLEIKGGLYENDVVLRSAFQRTDQAGATLIDFTGRDQRNRTAYLGELSLVYNRNLTRNLTCRLGYHAMWLGGVALASQNLNTDINLLALGPAAVQHDGDLILHGPTFGITWAR